jgi:redox-sensitive bicupin YhaK (pirin superfamily)
MIDLRAFDTLGGADHGWLRARHHFSFSGYQDPARMNWGALRVWNDDAIQPNTGFPPHAHQDMEIITYVLEGAISHQDSLGNQGRTAAGEGLKRRAPAKNLTPRYPHAAKPAMLPHKP